ncbi:MAG: 50S ribosomal protein L35ae [Candidatus Hydrothermarchaeota archaeon]
MKGVIINYCRSRKRQSNRTMVARFEGINDYSEASRLIGKEIKWKNPAGREIRGKIIDVHGTNGQVKVRFNKGLPGQAIGTEISLK